MAQPPDLATPPSSPSRALSGTEIARATGLIVMGFVFSRLLGVLREAIIGGVFGASSAYDAYAAAFQVPDTIFFVIAGGAIGSAFIPTFASYLTGDDQNEAWRMASAVLNLFILVLVGVSVLCIVFARPILTHTVAQGFDPAVQDLTVHLARVMLISPIIFGLSGLVMGILNAHQHFLLPALAPSMYNTGIIIGATVFATVLGMGIVGVAWGVVLGSAMHLIIQLPGLFLVKARYHPVFTVKHPGVREVAWLMGPRVLGQAIVQVNFWVNKSLASGMAEGSVGAIQRAWYLMLLPEGLIAQSVATAVFPTFAAQVADGDTAALRRTLGRVLRAVLFLAIPATVGLILLRLPIIRLMYERGAFTPEDSQSVAWALLFYGLGLIFHSLVEVITRAFYALHDTRTPVIVGGIAMAINVGLSFYLIGVMGDPGNLARGPFAGLALANTLATSLEGLSLFFLIRRRVGGLEDGRLLISVGRAGLASLGMGLTLWALMPAIKALGQYIGPLAGVAAGGGVFWGIAWLLRSEEVKLFTGIAMQRLRRLQR